MTTGAEIGLAGGDGAGGTGLAGGGAVTAAGGTGIGAGAAGFVSPAGVHSELCFPVQSMFELAARLRPGRTQWRRRGGRSRSLCRLAWVARDRHGQRQQRRTLRRLGGRPGHAQFLLTLRAGDDNAFLRPGRFQDGLAGWATETNHGQLPPAGQKLTCVILSYLLPNLVPCRKLPIRAFSSGQSTTFSVFSSRANETIMSEDAADLGSQATSTESLYLWERDL